MTVNEGTKNPRSKLSEADVLKIRDLAKRYPYVVLAKRYKVSRTTISDIVYRKTWRHLPIPDARVYKTEIP